MVWTPGRHLTMLSADQFQHWKPLLASEEPSQEYLMLEEQIPKATSGVPEASLRLRSFFHGVSKLRSRVKNFLSMREVDPSEKNLIVDSYLRAAARLEEKVSGWCNDPSWLPRKILAEPSQLHFQGSPWTSGSLYRLHCFDSWDAFFHWNRFFVAKICLHAALLDVLSTFSGSHAVYEMIRSHTATLQETVRDFIGSLAYAFGDVDRNGLSRPSPTAFVNGGAGSELRGIDVPSTLQVSAPLSYLVSLEYLDPGQREAMYLALQRIRGEFCVM
jgi:hypothetical protein